MATDPLPADILETVLGAGKPAGARRLPIAGFAALVTHASIVLGLMHGARAPRRAADAAQTRLPPELEIDVATERPSVKAAADPDRQPPPPPTSPAARRSPAPQARDPRPARARSSGAEAAQAATVIVQQPAPGGPVDLTADAVVTGTATVYAGGATTPGGTAAAAVPGRLSGTGVPGPEAAPATPSRASPVSLESEHWSCPWPQEADAQQIDEQTVVLRVVVVRDGAAEAATVLADPGHGFGPAAAACALRTRFTPARNRQGEPVRATSPPIRVRFTR